MTAIVIWLIGWMFTDGFVGGSGSTFFAWPLELGEHFRKDR